MPSRLGSRLQELERFDNAGGQSPKHGNDGLALVGLRPAEAYMEGRLVVVLRIEARSRPKANRWGCWLTLRSARDNSDAGNSAASGGADISDDSELLRRQQDFVLIGNVEDMELNEIVPLPSRVGLHIVGQNFDNPDTGAVPVFFMSLHHGFTALPRVLATGIDDREKGTLVRRVASGSHEFAIGVVKGGPEIVQSIAEDRWGVLGEMGSERFPARLAVVLGNEGLSVCRSVAFEDAFEIVDVMFGPFGL